MRKIYLLLLLAITTQWGYAADRYWVGASGATWENSTNWSATVGGVGGVGVPAANDNVYFTLSGDITIPITSSTTFPTTPSGFNIFSITGSGVLTFTYNSTTAKTINMNSSSSGGFTLGGGTTMRLLGTTQDANFLYTNGNIKLGLTNGVNTIDGNLIVAGSSSQMTLNSSTNLTINGTITHYANSGNISTSTGVITVNATGILQWYRNGGTVPGAAYNVSSFVKYFGPAGLRPDGSTNFVPTGTIAGLTINGTAPYNLPNVEINVTNGSGIANWSFPSNMTIKGNLNIVNYATGTMRFATTLTGLLVEKDFTTNGLVNLSNPSSGTNTMTVNGNILVNTGTLDISASTSNLNLICKGNLTVNGILTRSSISTSNVQFTGALAQTLTVGPTGSITGIPNLIVNNTGNNLFLGSNVTLPGTLTLTASKAILGANNLSVLSLTGSATNYVVTDGVGSLTIRAIANGTLKTFRIGSSLTNYDELYFNPTNTVDVTINVKNALTVPAAIPTSATTIEWDIVPSAIPGATTMDFKPSILPSALPGAAIVGHLESGVWVEYPATFATDTWTITAYNGTFSPFTVSSSQALPLTISSIKADVTGATNTISWITSTENNNRKFVVERSTDGTNFTAIGDVATKAINGNSNIALNYNFIDVNPRPGKAFYRLQMLDNKNVVKYSPIVTIRRGAGKLEIVDVRPNPTTGTLYFNVLGATSNLNVVVRDLSGKAIIKKSLLQNGNFRIDMSQLAGGMYILETVDVRNGEKAMFKVVKQ
jgi:hypothetical protein